MPLAVGTLLEDGQPIDVTVCPIGPIHFSVI